MRKLLVVTAYAYPAALLALAVGFWWVGEDWWVTAAGLYVPRLPLALLLPVLIALLWLAGLRRLLWTQAVAAALIVFPLMGYSVPFSLGARSAAPTLRVLTFNVNSAFGGVGAIASKIFAESPDVVLLEEAPWHGGLAGALRTRFPYVQSSTEFILASRYRILSTTDPKRIPFFGRARSPQFMRYVLETPLGTVAVYGVHPLSPRGLLHVRHFRAAPHALRTGELLAGDPEGDVRANVALRGLQIEAVAREAASEALPVVIAGDTNLPGLSALFRKNFSRFEDGFRAVNWGFGYTYPSRYPFLRLDRILTNDKLRFVSFRVSCKGVSDHLCVVAGMQAAR